MADIFGGTEPPRWLQAIARPPERGEAGQVFGTLLAGAFNAAMDAKQQNQQADAEQESDAIGPIGKQPTERTTWLQQIPQGLFEAKMNMADPLWKVHVAQQGATIIAKQAQAQLDMQKADLIAHQSQLEIQDAPDFTQFIKDLGANPNIPLQQFRSPKYNQQALAAWTQVQKQQIDNQKLTTKIAEDKIKAGLDERRVKVAEDTLGLKQEQADAEANLDIAPQVFEKTLPSGRKVEGVYTPKTGRFVESKEEKTPEEGVIAKESNRIRQKIANATVNLKKAQAAKKVGEEDATKDEKIDTAMKEVEAWKAELRKLQTPSVSIPATNAPSQVGRFLVTPK